MPQPLTPQTPQTLQTPRQTVAERPESEVQYVRRGRTVLAVTVSLLIMALLVLTLGFLAATRTDNVRVAGFYSGIALSFGAFLGIVALHLVENRQPMLIASIIFISMGVITAFICAIVDGIIASQLIDIQPLQEDACEFYGSASGYAYDTYYTQVTCRASDKTCTLNVPSNTCYCCYLYICESNYQLKYFMFTGVSSCWDVIHLHRLLWASVVLNVVTFFLGIITAALLGAFKDLQKPTRNIPPSPQPPPHILYNPNQHIITYASFCPPPQALPAYPNYPLPLQQSNSYQAPGTPQPIPGSGCLPSPQPCEPSQSQQPPQATGQPQGCTQETGGYMLTPNAPNAPMLYGDANGPFEKPPPYAY